MGVMKEAMLREMALRGFAPRTQKVYVSWVKRLVSRTRVLPDKLSESQVRTYLAGLAQAGLSASTLNQAISAVRFFFNAVLHPEWPLELRYQRAPQLSLSLRQHPDLEGEADRLRPAGPRAREHQHDRGHLRKLAPRGGRRGSQRARGRAGPWPTGYR